MSALGASAAGTVCGTPSELVGPAAYAPYCDDGGVVVPSVAAGAASEP